MGQGTINHMEPTREAGRAFLERAIEGPVVMLNLLRFRAVADYSGSPELAPPTHISVAAAYQRYIAHTMPYLTESGGEMLFLGEGGRFLIGPAEERWDMVMLIRQKSVQGFMAFAANEAYLAGLGHRTAALEDSRLLRSWNCLRRPDSKLPAIRQRGTDSRQMAGTA